jgi:RNA polymerase sigma-70 factor (ECF subfamily)
MRARLSGDLERALAKIPARQRQALLLSELNDMTGLELAEALGVSHVAARALLTRGRESLRQALAIERARSAVEDEKHDRAAAPLAARDQRDRRDDEDGPRTR